MQFVLRCEMPVDLVVMFELLGKVHRFRFEEREIDVTLPKRFSRRLDEGYDPEDARLARCVGSSEGQGEESYIISINYLFVNVELLDSDGLNVAEEMIISDESTTKLFWDENTSENFDNATKHLSSIASRAFDYWCRVVRWKTANAFVGPPLDRQDAHEGMRHLASVDPLEHVASMKTRITAIWHEGMPTEDWVNIQETLCESKQPPIWIDAYHDARRRLAVGDVRGAFLEAAISVEAFIRQKVMASLDPLPNDEPAIRKRLEMWPMTDIFANFKKLNTLSSLELSPDAIRVLRETFETRNSIMHGKSVELDRALLKTTLSTVKAIIYT